MYDVDYFDYKMLLDIVFLSLWPDMVSDTVMCHIKCWDICQTAHHRSTLLLTFVDVCQHRLLKEILQILNII